MDLQRLIFVSAVSNEFHHSAPEEWRYFASYRDVIKQAFRNLDPGYYVMTQEDLIQGFGSLLEKLEQEVARSLFIIHLVGDSSGVIPQAQERRSLCERHTSLLSKIPELRAAVGDGQEVTYTQWEVYFAFHYAKPALIFEAQPTAPRSPRFAPTSADAISQAAHRRRLEMTGHHRGFFHDQGDVARKCVRSFLHWRVDTLVDPIQPLPEDIADARAHQEQIVRELVTAIKDPDPRAVPARDAANTAAFIAAIRAAAARWRVSMAAIVDIAASHEDQVRAAVGHLSTPEAFYDEAFASFALGDYTAACFGARRAADTALTFALQEPENAHEHHEAAQKALLLLHDVAKAANDISTAIQALEEAIGLIDKQTDPLRWADVSEVLVEFLLAQANWDRAEQLVSDIIDVREEYQGESHPAVAEVLLLWCSVLDSRSNDKGVEGVAKRAERIFASQTPPNFDGIVATLTFSAHAVMNQNRPAESETLLRHAVAIAEFDDGAEGQKIITPLGNLAELLHLMNRLEEAEPLMYRVLAITEKYYGSEHPEVAVHLNNLGSLLRTRERLGEAEILMRRTLAISEKVYGNDHPLIAVPLKNLGEILMALNRLNDAEPLIRRALEIDSRSYGPKHPKVAISLNNLASLLCYKGQHHEAEPLIRRALEIEEGNFGSDHPNIATILNTLAVLLIDTGRVSEAEPLLHRAYGLLIKFADSTGSVHPNFQLITTHYEAVLRRLGRSHS